MMPGCQILLGTTMGLHGAGMGMREMLCRVGVSQHPQGRR